MRILFLSLCIVELLFSFDVQKPKVYSDQNVSGWYMSEKLDGIRGYWDGKQLYTKNAIPIHAPEYFTKNFPTFPLDGELWSKRDDFENIQSIVLDKVASKKWEEITYNIFEVPYSKGDFLQRLNKAKDWFSQHANKNVNIVAQIKCKDTEHLNEFLEKIVTLKGEGIIIKDGTKDYHTGRSSYSLKVKKFLDMEGRVIGHNYKKDGNFKSLKIKLENETVFNLGGGLTKEHKKNPPKIGTMVTFKYYGFTKNKKPKFASFLRVRDKE